MTEEKIHRCEHCGNPVERMSDDEYCPEFMASPYPRFCCDECVDEHFETELIGSEYFDSDTDYGEA